MKVGPWPVVLDRWPMVKRCLVLFEYLRAGPSEVAYDKLLDRIINEQFSNASVPDVLCHYTSINAFESIVTTRLLWGVSHLHMDDKNELRAIDGLIDDVLSDLAREIAGPASQILKLFAEHHPDRRIADQIEIGLRCFTAECDSRSHWDKFTPGGQGVCIAFRRIEEEQHPVMLEGHVGTGLYPIEYDRSVWRQRLKQDFMAVLDAFNDYAASGSPMSERLVVRRTVVALAQIAALASIAAKDWSLRDEKEWRHVLYPWRDATVEWKTMPNGKRYLALPARAEGKLLLLDRVIVRSTNPEEDVKRVAGILREAGYPSADVPMPEVTVSAYPFEPKRHDWSCPAPLDAVGCYR